MSRTIPGMDPDHAICDCGANIISSNPVHGRIIACEPYCAAECGRKWCMSVRNKVIPLREQAEPEPVSLPFVEPPMDPLTAPVDLEQYVPGGTVVRMVEHCEGVPAPDLRAWAQSWIDCPALDAGACRSVVLLVERMDGTLGLVLQSLVPSDGRRTVGLLVEAQHRTLHGKPQGLL